GRSRAVRPAGDVDGRPGSVPLQGPEHAVRGLAVAGSRHRDVARGPVHARRRGRAVRAAGGRPGRRARTAVFPGAPAVRRPAMLALEDGRVFAGDGFGAEAETTGEVVF